MAEKSIHIVDLKTADSITGEEYLVLQDAGGITYTPVTDAEAPSFEAGKYFQAQSDGTYIALETCPDNWQTMYNQCYTRTIPDTQKVPVKLIAGKAGAEIKTAAEWESENPVLSKGQIGVESDTNKLKIGDGNTAWSSLLYKPGTSTEDGGEIFNSYKDDEENGIYKNSASEYAHAEGQSTKATGLASHAEGQTTVAIGEASHAEGMVTKADGNASHAEGNGAATGRRAYKINEIDTENSAYKLSSIEGLTVGDNVYYSTGNVLTGSSFGKITSIDTGNNSVATEPFVDWGSCDYIYIADATKGDVIIGGGSAHAEGYRTKAEGGISHAEGNQTTAEGGNSHAEGYRTVAREVDAHAEGNQTYAFGEGSHVEGYYTKSYSKGSHVEGFLSAAGQRGYLVETQVAAVKEYTVDAATIDSNFAVGTKVSLYDLTTRKQYVNFATITAVDATNNIITVDTFQECTEGDAFLYLDGGPSIGEETVWGEYAHAEGSSTKADGNSSHAEGESSQSWGRSSHAEGSMTKAIGNYSHAEGQSTQAAGNNSHAEGHTTIASNRASHAEGLKTQASGIASHAEGVNSQAQGMGSHAEGSATAYGIHSHAESGGLAGIKYYQVTNIDSTNKKYTLDSVSNLYAGFKVYKYTLNATNPCSIDPIGVITGVNSDALTISLDTIDTTVSYIWVENGHFGSKISGGTSAHAEGSGTAFGEYSHAEGNGTTAIGDYSHTEGGNTLAAANYSHAEGKDTQAIGSVSHAEGEQTIAAEYCQHVEGSYNIPDYDCNYIHIIGNGGDKDNRSNAHTVDWAGNAWYKGNVRVGGTSYDDAYELAIKIKAIPHTTASGTDSVSITDFLNSEEVINYKIYGNSIQNGTPSTESPVKIQSVGDLVTDESSEYYGKYKIILSGCGQNIPIYLNAPLRQRGNVADYIDFENQQVVRMIEVVDDTGTKTIDESFSVLSTPTSETLSLGSLVILSGSVSVTVSVGSATAPSQFDLTYFQDINKVIAELKNALTQS